MILSLRPVSFLKGCLDLPSSKSYSIRAFMISSCGGFSQIMNPSDCDDAKIALKVTRSLGAKVLKRDKNVFLVKASDHFIERIKINVGESGTVLRLLLPLIALRTQEAVIEGEGTLRTRPNHHLIRTLRNMGVIVQGRGAQETVPIVISRGKMRGGQIEIEGGLSSQFISALLIVCPLLDENSVLTVKGKKIVSSHYITMTQRVLAQAGVSIRRKGTRDFIIKGRQRFKGLGQFIVPSDYGLAAFFLVAGAILPSQLILKGHFDDRLVQADGEILPLLSRMGARFTQTSDRIKIEGPFNLQGGDFSLKDCPDLVPILSVAALFAKNKTRFYDIAHVRSKESDRISDLRQELRKIGAKIVEKENEIIIFPQSSYQTKNIVLDPHHDHRLAMAFSILGLRLGIRVKDIECTSKSYPGFQRDLQKILRSS